MKKTLLKIFAVLVLFSGCTSLKPGVKDSSHPESALDFRLSPDVKPLKYDLTLRASPEKDHFAGEVGIDLELTKDQNSILIHGQDLKVLSVKLKNGSNEIPGKFKPVGEEGLARIEFDQVIKSGKYRLEIGWNGKFQEDLSGLYRVKDGNESYLFTQFEPLSARKMLPCFDEPRWKTPFAVKIISKAGNHVIANSKLETVAAQGEDQVHIFAETKPIPTYLLALAVGPFDIVQGPVLKGGVTRKNDIEFRGIAVKGKGQKLEFALKETPLIVEKLEEYFGVAYPYDKLDVLAVPDFGAGAMENVGAITFREWYLLLDEKTASIDQKRGFHLVMAHELAHQWFGNLVTMPWWDDLWLNEAFATWLSYKIIDGIKPEYKSSSRLLGRSHSAMVQDSLMAARQIREPIKSHHDIHNAFDSITYSKGGAVLSMLENYLGADSFRQAVSEHIKKYSWGTATSQEFLQSLAKFSDASLVNSAETFLNQTGLPLVELSYTCKGGETTINLKQQRYLPVGSKIDANRSWGVPMCLGYDAGSRVKKHCFTFKDPAASIKIKEKKCPTFVMPNLGGQGYYRFSLDEASWQKLLKHGRQRLKENDRISMADSLVGDLYRGHLQFPMVAESLRGLIDASSSMVTGYFMNLMKEADQFWVEAENHSTWETHAKGVMRSVYDGALAKKKLSDDQRLLRKDISGFLAKTIKDKSARLDLSAIGSAYLGQVLDDAPQSSMDSPEIDENLLDDAVGVALQYQDDSYLERVIAKLVSLNDTVLRGHLLFGLALSREGDEAQKIRTLVFNENLRKNEKLALFYMHLDNVKNQPATWNFVVKNFDELKKVLSKSQMGNLPYLAEGLCTNEDAQAVNNFFKPVIKEFKGGPRNLAEVVEKIELCAATKQHTTAMVNKYFVDLKDKAVVVK